MTKQTEDNGLSKKTLQITGMTFSFMFIIIIFGFVIVFPCPTEFQYIVVRLILALVVAIPAGFFLTGKIELKYKIGLVATASTAIFVIIFFDNPKEIFDYKKCAEPKTNTLKPKNDSIRISEIVKQPVIIEKQIKAESIKVESGYLIKFAVNSKSNNGIVIFGKDTCKIINGIGTCSLKVGKYSGQKQLVQYFVDNQKKWSDYKNVNYENEINITY